MSFPGRLVTIDGLRIFVHRSVSGRGLKECPLVLLHGMGMSHFAWRKVIPVLAESGREVIAFDWPGFGESDRPPRIEYRYDAQAFQQTLLGLLDYLGIQRATLIGHSMGGAVALQAAAKRPERIDRLVVVAPAVFPARLMALRPFLSAPFLGEAMFRALCTRGLMKRTLRREMYLDPALATEEWVDYLWERINRPGGFQAAFSAMQFLANPGSVEQSVRAVRAPTLVVWGREDRLYPVSIATKLKEEMARTEVIVLEQCGHSPPEERANEFAQATLSYLGGSEEGLALG